MSDIQINKHKIARYFYMFLITNHALYNFFENFDKLDYQKYLSKTNEQDFLYHAFFWGDTKEGFHYWHGLNNTWQNLLNKLH